MKAPRELPLYDPNLREGSWNERMVEGEYAVHSSSFDGAGFAPYCTVFGGLDEAEEFARERVAAQPAVRCTIYDHRGMIGAPLRDLRGSKYKGDGDLTPRFRRWAGSMLFFGGIILVGIDWVSDFRLSWPALIGSRLLIPGLVLLFTEAMIVMHARIDRRRAAAGGGAR